MQGQPPDPDDGVLVEVDTHTGRVVRIPGVYPDAEVVGWLVVSRHGARSLHLERPAAEAYAARVHGVCRALYVAA